MTFSEVHQRCSVPKKPRDLMNVRVPSDSQSRIKGTRAGGIFVSS